MVKTSHMLYYNYPMIEGGIVYMWTKVFWKDVGERMIATAFQVLLALIAVDGFSLATVDFAAFATAIGVAVVTVFAKAVIAASSVKDTVSPASLAKE